MALFYYFCILNTEGDDGVSKKVLFKRGCGKVKGCSVDAETNKTESNKIRLGSMRSL